MHSDQRGSLDALLIPLILISLLFLGAVAFGYWAFSSRQDYKNHVDQKIAVAVQANTAQVQAVDTKNYAEKEKQPLATYTSPEKYGSIVIKYPKTWSAYVDDTGNGSTLVNGYFYPKVVPSTDDQSVTFALRLELVNQTYDQVMQQFASLVQSGAVTVSPYVDKNVPNASTGSRVDGEIQSNKQGSMIVLPLRNQTIELWTESQNFEPDFNNILPNFTFSP